MCGIAGIFAFTKTGRTHFSKLEEASAALAHRGPDAKGVFTAGSVSLAVQRLAIISPDASADQPISDPERRYTIIFNGEIFNYKQLRAKLQNKGIPFSTEADTEVVLRLYMDQGQNCLKKLRGFFAFCIYDAAEDSLFIARDRFGEKPFLYYKDADKFMFGSELRALFKLDVPRELDYTSLYQYLQLTYVPAPASMVKGVKKLLPGHSLFIKGNKVQESVWYRLPFDAEKVSSQPLTYKQQQTKLRQLLENAVEERSIADVPVGAMLSGGLDSSVIVGLASQQNPNLKTFSVGFKEEKFFDETHFSRSVAEKYKTDHTEILLSTKDLSEHLTGMLHALSEPFADSSALAIYCLSKYAGKELKVVLSGDGADELFAGYSKHLAEYKILNRNLVTEAAINFDFLWGMYPGSRNSFLSNKVRQLHRFAAGAKLAAEDRYWFWATWQNEAGARGLLNQKVKTQLNNRLYAARKNRLLNCISGNLYSLNNVLCADWHLVLGNDMLPKIDLMGMANSLEIRSPYLDHRVVKFAFSLPEVSKLNGKAQKRILQDAFKDLLPAELYNRPKKGFEIPLLPLLRKEMRSMIDYYLSDAYLIAQGIFDVQQVGDLKKKLFSKSGGQVQTQIWTILVFQHWWEQWVQEKNY